MSHIVPPGGGGGGRPTAQRPITIRQSPNPANPKIIEIFLPFFFSEEEHSDEVITAGSDSLLVRGRVISNRTDRDDSLLPVRPSFESEITGIKVFLGNNPNPECDLTVGSGVACRVEISFGHP